MLKAGDRCLFDILGFSLSYELGATNILEMLIRAGAVTGVGSQICHSMIQRHLLIFCRRPHGHKQSEPYALLLDFIALGDGEGELPPEIGQVLRPGRCPDPVSTAAGSGSGARGLCAVVT